MNVDQDAEVYRKHRDDLLRYATSLVGASSAEDVLSTVVLRTIRRQPLSEIENPRAYLMKSVLNECRSIWRRRAPGLTERVHSTQLPVEVVETLEVIMRLPVQERAAVYLFYWEDHPVAQIAELMGIREGTVKRYLFNARNRLKDQLK